jgi:hypothetical protein
MNTDLIDGITLDFENLAGIIGVCRVAAIAAAGDGEAQAALRDSDMPDALYAARELSASLKARVAQLHREARPVLGGEVAGSASAAGVAGLIDSVQARVATIDGLAARILESCSGEDRDRAALADAIVTVAGKVTEELQAALELTSPAPTRREGRE